MLYCEKCDDAYETDQCCRCPAYTYRCENGQKNRVPLFWRKYYWEGYVYDPDDCEHRDFDEWMDGSRKCLGCGLKREGLAD